MSQEDWYRIKECLILARLKIVRESLEKNKLTTQEKYEVLKELDGMIEIIGELSCDELDNLSAAIDEILDHYEE
ncbi:MAG TPA: hypothetical protein ENH40_04165 [Nitrospirae bacterium]|nr:hypothetical protein [Nitrospirota bacterium]